jgi:hypothetical protein
MGFDLNIQLSLTMCPETGKPFYYKLDKNTGEIEKIYSIPDIEVPEKYRPYLDLRGSHLHAYTHMYNEENQYDVEVDVFNEDFPSWEDVESTCEDSCADHGWYKEDHKMFHKLIKWCCKQEAPFRVTWSY